jgi:hypothetical protein
VKERQLDIEQLPQATGADETENGRHADIHFPAVERIGDELRRYLRQVP